MLQAILSKQRAETLSSVLYPDDRTYEGKELRLKQQHFFVSATIQASRLPLQRVLSKDNSSSAGLGHMTAPEPSACLLCAAASARPSCRAAVRP